MNTNYTRTLRYIKQMRFNLEKLLSKNGERSFEIQKLVAQIRNAVNRLKGQISKNQLRNALGGLAVFFGLAVAPEVAAQPFSPGINNPFGLTPSYNISLPSLVDIDNDGDLDMVVIEDYGNLKYFQNTGTASSPQFAVSTSPNWLLANDSVLDISFGDLDNDGDYDILAVKYGGDIIYKQNTGTATNPQFASAVINPFGINSGPIEVGVPVLVDIDGDGDLDLFVSEYYGSIYYYQNTGTASVPNFSTAPIANPFGINVFSYLRVPTFFDLDADGDYDLMIADYYGNIFYYENTGTATNPQFGMAQSNPFNFTGTNIINKFAAGDIDGDGDIDLFLGVDGFYNANYEANIIYFENISPVGLRDYRDLGLSIYPNPTTDRVHIETPIPVKYIRITHMDGRLIREEKYTDFSISDLAAGMYLLTLVDVNLVEHRKKVIKK